MVNDAKEDIQATIAFWCTDCGQNYIELIERGAISIEAPKEMPWVVKTAFVQGPGMLTIEIEETLKR